MSGYTFRWLDQVPDLLATAKMWPERFPYLLESTARAVPGSCSLLLYAGEEILTLEADRRLNGPGEGPCFFDRFESWYRAEEVDNGTAPLADGRRIPFIGGWFVYLGYEIAAQVEPTLRLPDNLSGLPDAFVHRCPGAIVIFHDDGGLDRAIVVAQSDRVLERILGAISYGGHLRVGDVPGGEATYGRDQPCVNRLSFLQPEDPEHFKRSVARIHEYLLAGDVFQVNISRPWHGEFHDPGDPFELYRSLRQTNPAPFAGLLRWGDKTVLSSSPERLVQITGNEVQTRPIAGTRPRGGTAGQDRALSLELRNNLKEQAEHIMLIDLERNDLGRVCHPGTVEVDELMVIETYAHVHHIVSNVRGQLREDASPVDVIRAVFPGGTITGCPKVRCMEIIAELEAQGRSFYTGSMGYLGVDGSMDLNILIRSMLVQENRFSFRTGAGIVADSVADSEVQETEDKARGMLLALAAEEQNAGMPG